MPELVTQSEAPTVRPGIAPEKYDGSSRPTLKAPVLNHRGVDDFVDTQPPREVLKRDRWARGDPGGLQHPHRELIHCLNPRHGAS